MEHVALLLLRSLVARLEKGEVEIAELASAPDVLSLKWRPAAQPEFVPPNHMEAPAPPLAAGDDCPSCGATVRDISGSLMCPRCGTVG